jgi:hypothetical protein
MKRVTIVVGFALAVACGKGENAQSDSPAGAGEGGRAGGGSAAVRIVSPENGDSTGADVTIDLFKRGVTIEAASGTRVEGVGHHHLFLDTAATPAGEIIPPASAHVIHIGTGDSSWTFKGLSPGPHTVIAVMGYGDHAAMDQRRDTVRFIVRR